MKNESLQSPKTNFYFPDEWEPKYSTVFEKAIKVFRNMQ